MKFLVLCLLAATVSASIDPLFSGKLPRLPILPESPNAAIEGRITHGQEASPGQFPYQTGLSLQLGDKSAWCGGTLISNQYVVTAAHCADGVDGATVYLGAHNIKNENEPHQKRIYVAKSGIKVHENWDATLIKNDIALIKLPEPVEFNDYIQPATLPKKKGYYDSYDGQTVWASGWGKDSDKATSVSPVLRYIQAPVKSNSVCSRYYLGAVDNNMICISGKGGASTCNGDSGGPLVKKENGINYLVGATSFGIGLGCEVGFPAVFTRITSYLDWIEQNSGVVNK